MSEDRDTALAQEEESDLYKEVVVDVDPGQQPLRIDKYLQNKLEKISRNRIQNAARAGSIYVGEKAVKPSHKVKGGDRIKLVLPRSPGSGKLEGEDIPIEIIYEDADLLVVHKAVGMVVHPGHGNWTGTLVNALIHHAGTLPDDDGEEQRPGLVHRLDKNTSGLMVVAKNEFARTFLAKQFYERTVKRLYHALVWGQFEENEGTVDAHIGRHPRYRQRFTVFPEGETGKAARTHYKVLEELGYVSLIECRLETGRTHQIRVHMQHCGHPLFGDPTYGGNHIVRGTVHSKYKQFVEGTLALIEAQMLHAKTLGFIHPSTGEELFFESELPSAFTDVVDRWRTYMQGRAGRG